MEKDDKHQNFKNHIPMIHYVDLSASCLDAQLTPASITPPPKKKQPTTCFWVGHSLIKVLASIKSLI